MFLSFSFLEFLTVTSLPVPSVLVVLNEAGWKGLAWMTFDPLTRRKFDLQFPSLTDLSRNHHPPHQLDFD